MQLLSQMPTRASINQCIKYINKMRANCWQMLSINISFTNNFCFNNILLPHGTLMRSQCNL